MYIHSCIKYDATCQLYIPAEQSLAERVSQRWQPAGQPLAESLSHLSLFLPPSPAIINTVFMSPQLHYYCKTLPCLSLPILCLTCLLATVTFCPHKACSRCLRWLVALSFTFGCRGLLAGHLPLQRLRVHGVVVWHVLHHTRLQTV